MSRILSLALLLWLCGCTTHPRGAPFSVPSHYAPQSWTLGGTTWKLVALSYHPDGGFTASYRLPDEVGKKGFTECIGFRIYNSETKLEDYIRALASVREFDHQIVVKTSRLDDASWLVTHSSPLWNEHGVSLLVTGSKDGFLFYYTARDVERWRERVEAWTKLLAGPRELKGLNQVLQPTTAELRPCRPHTDHADSDAI